MKVNLMAKFSVSLTLKRDNDKLREHHNVFWEPGDETWFDVENITTEIQVWLENLDFAVSNINISECDET